MDDFFEIINIFLLKVETMFHVQTSWSKEASSFPEVFRQSVSIYSIGGAIDGSIVFSDVISHNIDIIGRIIISAKTSESFESPFQVMAVDEAVLEVIK